MKIKQGFISNSSSASFVISKYEINARQLDQIVDHAYECQVYDMDCSPDEAWDIDSNTHFLMGSTGMDNFDMKEFLLHIKVDPDVVKWR